VAAAVGCAFLSPSGTITTNFGSQCQDRGTNVSALRRFSVWSSEGLICGCIRPHCNTFNAV
jgi:hypothetical protein